MPIKVIGLRWVSYILIGILFRLIANFIFGLLGAESHLTLLDFAVTIGSVVFLLEGLRWISRRMDQQVLWIDNPLKRFFLQLGASLLFTIVTTTLLDWAFPYFVLKIPVYVEWQFQAIWPELLLSNILVLLFIGSVIGVEFGNVFLERWRNSLIELERFKKENIESQFEVLKSQVNPHFLFNSLNTLSSLIYVDQNAAAKFIRQLSKVYRYVLENKDNETIKLEQELETLEAYLFLIETRFSNKFSFRSSIPDQIKQRKIAPMVLQMLIENTIKHNVISMAKPLQVELLIEDDDYLVVQNNFQPKSSQEYTSQMGLNNIINRYRYLTSKSVQISQRDGKFIVKIPFLTEQQGSDSSTHS